MKKVDQTVFGAPGGNCFSACVASILEIETTDVPYFMGDYDDDGKWWDRFLTWLRPRGFWAMMFDVEPRGWRPKCYHILSGPANRGLDHSVVAFDDHVVHDPHPSRDGLTKPHDVVVLIPTDPARHYAALREGGG